MILVNKLASLLGQKYMFWGTQLVVRKKEQLPSTSLLRSLPLEIPSSLLESILSSIGQTYLYLTHKDIVAAQSGTVVPIDVILKQC